jgi:hypothetical protein
MANSAIAPAPMEETTGTGQARLLWGWQIPFLVATSPPALAAALAARRVTNAFGSLAEVGGSASEVVSLGLYQANRPLVAAIALSGLITLGFGVVQFAGSRRRLTSTWLLLAAMLTGVALLPSLFLWSAESITTAVVIDQVGGSSERAAERLAALLKASTVGGFVIAPLAFTFTLIAGRVTPRSGPSRLQGLTWLLAGAALALLAVLFHLRSASLVDTAMSGGMRSIAEPAPRAGQATAARPSRDYVARNAPAASPGPGSTSAER